MSPKTIQIFLPEGLPTGIRVAEITNRIITALVVPRNKLKLIEGRKEAYSSGLYMLIGKDENNQDNNLAYIGQAKECLIRIKNHDQNKEFWNLVIIFTTKDNHFTRGHLEYLEWLCIDKAKNAERYLLQNDKFPPKPNISESLEWDLVENFNDIRLLLSTLGILVFEDLEDAKKEEIFYCKGPGANASGAYTDEGLVVFKGSIARKEISAGTDKFLKLRRDEFIEKNILEKKDESLIFTQDYLFSSPTAASRMVLGRNSNGWMEWKNQEGKTLDEIKRIHD